MEQMTQKIKELHGQLENIRKFCFRFVWANQMKEDGFGLDYGEEQLRKDADQVIERMEEILPQINHSLLEEYVDTLFSLKEDARNQDNPLQYFESESIKALPRPLQKIKELQPQLSIWPQKEQLQSYQEDAYRAWLRPSILSDKIVGELCYYDRYPLTGRIRYIEAENQAQMEGMNDQMEFTGSVGSVGK